MRFSSLLRVCIVLMCCCACASGPAPPRDSKHVRQSLRYLNKGAELYAKGCFSAALERFFEAHERYAAADHGAGVAASLNSIANAYFQLDDFESALVVYDEAIEWFDALDDSEGLVRAMVNKGATLIADGQLDAAQALLDKADALGARIGILPILRLKTKAILLMQRNDQRGAKRLLQKALDRSDQATDDQLAAVHYTMGRLLLAGQDPEGAVRYFTSALDHDRARGAYRGIAEDLSALGGCYEQMGRLEQAVFYYKRSIKGFALIGDMPSVDSVRSALERTAAQTGADIRATIHWVEQWRIGKREANLCR